MGKMIFNLPSNLPLEVTQDLERTCVTGGPDAMPTLCQVNVEPNKLAIIRDSEESGCVIAPWLVQGAGHILVQTATLIEKTTPYQLQLELARGKINQVRNQAAEWLFAGLNMPPALNHQIREATRAFTRGVVRGQSEESNQQAETALIQGCEAADQLVHAYADQVIQIRQQRQPKLETTLGCRLGTSIPVGQAADTLVKSCNGISIPFSIHEVAPAEGDYHWDSQDALVKWAQHEGLAITGGPLVDFSYAGIPSCLWLWAGDRGKIAKLLCEYTADVLERYQNTITTWQLTAASNLPGVLSLNDDELLWLTLQIGETARQIAPTAGLVIGISQPWGDYLREAERMYSPIIFADHLLRAGLSVTAFDLEIVMGVTPRGSYCRDLLDFSRLLDMYGFFGLPLHITLGYPGERAENDHSSSELDIRAGYWRNGINSETQAEWATEFLSLAICKPFVRSVQWVQFSDQNPHQFPNCGLIAPSGTPRPVAASLRKIRDQFLH